MLSSTLEAYDFIRFAETFGQRLVLACSEFAQKSGFSTEKSWMSMACDWLQAAREPAKLVLERARWLPELGELREEYLVFFQGQWVDALERLQSSFAHHTSARDPLVEAIFPSLKFAPLRRASREAIQDYVKELERRLKSSYVGRMLALPAYQFATPALEQMATTYFQWNLAFDCPEMPPEQQEQLRFELLDSAARLEVVYQQSRLIAEAALLPIPGMFDDTSLHVKPRKRSRNNVESTNLSTTSFSTTEE